MSSDDSSDNSYAGVEQCVTSAGYRAIIRNVVYTPNFQPMNSHLTLEEIRGLVASPPQWPDSKPVFSSYAPRKPNAYYTQAHVEKQFTTDNTRRQVLMHRLTCAQMHGPAPVGYQCSHRLGSGVVRGIERDMNPNNLCWEMGSVNKSRGFCQMYHAARMTDIREERAIAGQPISEAGIWEIASIETEEVCKVVHGPNLCRFWHPSWGSPSSLVVSRQGPNKRRASKGQRRMGRPPGSKDSKKRKSRKLADRSRVERKRSADEPISLLSAADSEPEVEAEGDEEDED
jgi:hypothetical protein